MLVTTYFCDNCKLEFDRKFMHDVTIQVHMRCYTSALHVTKHICTNCLGKKGFVVKQYEDAVDTKTLEKRAIDLLTDLGVRFDA